MLRYATVVGELKRDAGISKGYAGELLADVSGLRRGGPQKLAARRGVKEQVAHLDGRANGASGRLRRRTLLLTPSTPQRNPNDHSQRDTGAPSGAP